jgi:hypothetical protein
MRIPPDAFDFYVSLGPERSYQAVAKRYGVSKRAVTKCAAREHWMSRLSKIEKDARENGDKRLAETMEQMHERHLKTVRAMQARALAALKQYPLSTGMEAMRAAEMAIKLERLVVGEPSERVNVEEIVRNEHQAWMVDDDQSEETLENGSVP